MMQQPLLRATRLRLSSAVLLATLAIFDSAHAGQTEALKLIPLIGGVVVKGFKHLRGQRDIAKAVVGTPLAGTVVLLGTKLKRSQGGQGILDISRAPGDLRTRADGCLMSSTVAGFCVPCMKRLSATGKLDGCDVINGDAALEASCNGVLCKNEDVLQNSRLDAPLRPDTRFRLWPISGPSPPETVSETVTGSFRVSVIYYRRDGDHEATRGASLANDIAERLKHVGAKPIIAHSDFSELGARKPGVNSILIAHSTYEEHSGQIVRKILDAEYRQYRINSRSHDRLKQPLQVLLYFP